MKGTECKFVKYMEGADKRFVIPVYQRNYDWKTENCKQLYDDLVKIIKEHRKSHFFGSLVSVYNPDGHNEEFLIIDGQQRLTTVSLLFLAMYNLIDKGIIVSETANLKQRIFEEYLVDKWKPEDTRIKLKPVKNDQKAFGKLLNGNGAGMQGTGISGSAGAEGDDPCNGCFGAAENACQKCEKKKVNTNVTGRSADDLRERLNFIKKYI